MPFNFFKPSMVTASYLRLISHRNLPQQQYKPLAVSLVQPLLLYHLFAAFLHKSIKQKPSGRKGLSILSHLGCLGCNLFASADSMPLGAQGGKVNNMLTFWKICHKLFLLIGIWYKGIRYRGENQVTRIKYLSPRTQLPAVIQHLIPKCL
jgi:hypothetical protein